MSEFSGFDLVNEQVPAGASGFDLLKDPAYAGMRPEPKSIKKQIYERALRTIPWGKIRDEVTVPIKEELKREALKGTEALKDSVNAFMYRSLNPSEKLIDEVVANCFRKLRK